MDSFGAHVYQFDQHLHADKIKEKEKCVRQHYCCTLYLMIKTHTLKKRQLVTLFVNICVHIYAPWKCLSISLFNSQCSFKGTSPMLFFPCWLCSCGSVSFKVSGIPLRSLWEFDPCSLQTHFLSVAPNGSSSGQLSTKRRNSWEPNKNAIHFTGWASFVEWTLIRDEKGHKADHGIIFKSCVSKNNSFLCIHNKHAHAKVLSTH